MTLITDLKRKNFGFNEFFSSDKYPTNQQEFYNLPDKMQLDYLKNGMLVADKIQEIRDFLNMPIIVSSGWRSPNCNKVVGGVETSQHLKFQAIDWFPAKDGKPIKEDAILTEILIKLKEAKIVVDQCLMEGTWIHTSIKEKGNRNQFATFRKNKNGVRVKVILK